MSPQLPLCLPILLLNSILPLSKTQDDACIPTDDIATGNTHSWLYDEFTFLTRDQWSASSWSASCSCSVNDTTEMIPLSDPNMITIHHTSSPFQSFSTNKTIETVQSIQHLHQDTNGWCDIGYHFLIDSAGNVIQGRPFWDDNETLVSPINISRKWPIPRLIENEQNDLNLDDDTNHIDIAVIGCYDSNPTNCPNGSSTTMNRYDPTYTRLVQLVSWLCGYYDIVPTTTTIGMDNDEWNVTEVFESLVVDVESTLNEGTGLCYDFVDADDEWTGGVCMNMRQCTGNDLVINTGDENQCTRYGQICCKIESNGDGVNDKDRTTVFLVIGLSGVVVLIIVGMVFVYKKRKDHTLRNSVYNDLQETVVGIRDDFD